MTPQTAPHSDDLQIADYEILLRFCKTRGQVTQNIDSGQFILSNQLFSGLKGGVSVEFLALVQKANSTIDERHIHNRSFGVVSITVQRVRETETGDPKTPPCLKLGIAFTPIAGDQPFGPNPYHGDIIPCPSARANKLLSKICKVEIEIDQAIAAEEYAKRTGHQ